MPVQPIVGGRYLVSWEDLGKPRVRGHYKLAGFGIVVLDDADVYYAQNTPDAKFFIRKCEALGDQHYVVISRMHPA